MIAEPKAVLNLPWRAVPLYALALLVLAALYHAPVLAQAMPGEAPSATPPAAAASRLEILYLREVRNESPPLSLLDIPPPDDGVSGAKLALSDNNTTGRFLKQEFALDVHESEKPEDLVAEARRRVDAGTAFIVADLSPAVLLAVADAIKQSDAVIFNAGTAAENVREEDCRANVLHTAPSRTMLADALGQYLAWKQWRRWFLIAGPSDEDKAFADALRRAAKRFGGRIVEERTFNHEPGSRRADGGYEQVQQQIPTFTQNAADHDVVVVADEGKLFGDYIPYRTWEPRPVAGTAGLFATSWHPAVELWGGTQFQNRFKRLAGRDMRPLDYNAWMAVRSIGEAATREKSVAARDLIPYFRSPEFDLAAFKGQKLTYRDWNGQLRQPVFVATYNLHVTVSPQPGFLHKTSELDTLGVDRPETRCKIGPS